MASALFKKKQNNLSSDLKDLSVSEAALSQSTFNVEKITEIQNKFRGGEVLLVPGRIFIRDGVLWKVCRKGPKKRQFFLFNDALVYGTIIGRGHYGNQHIMALSSMSVSADCHYMPQVDLDNTNDDKDSSSPSELKPENAFQINHSDKSFHVYSHSKADKGNWISNLNKQISKISKNRSSSDHVYQRAVWVPDAASKQCMICKQKFSAFVRKHHCRMCGRVVCSTCSPEKADITKLSGGTKGSGSGKLERVCKSCKKPVILVTGGGVMGMEKDATIELTTPGDVIDEGEESSETEDSDDSEQEETPVAPPRRKKQQQQQPLKKSPEQKKKSGPPPRPSYTPMKSHGTKTSDGDNQKNKEDNINASTDNTINNDDQIDVVVDESKGTGNDSVKGVSVKPPRPTSGPPRPSSPPTKPEPSFGSPSLPPRSESTGDKPVPKPRRLKKETDPVDTAVTSGADSSPILEHKESEHVNGDVIDGPEDNPVSTIVTNDVPSGENEDFSSLEVEKYPDQIQKEDELVVEDTTEPDTPLEVQEDVEPFDTPNLVQEQENFSQVENKDEVKSFASKRRKTKITRHSEQAENTAVLDQQGTPSTDSDPIVSAANVADLQPVEKTIRSPSTHARQRRSKFTTN